MEKILVVEDDSTLSFSIEYTLKSEGFETVHAENVKTAKEILNSENISLILLDVKLPDGTGYELCKDIRKNSNIPIIFLTACDEEVNIVTGLDMGADDYITKPFRIRELVSRIRAVLRRNTNISTNSKVLSSGNIRLYTLEGKLRKNDSEIILTALEYRLILTLMKHPKMILSRSVILNSIWDAGGEFVDDNTLSVYIRRLREKIEDNPNKPEYIVTARGIGYKWDMEVK